MSETVYDIASEKFADFALDQMDQDTRTHAKFTLEGNEFNGVVLGFGSSYSETSSHTGHFPGKPPGPGVRCSACRWADVAVMYTDVVDQGEKQYAVFLMGKSEIEGESTRVKPLWTSEAIEVLRGLAVSGARGEQGSAIRRIPLPNAVSFRLAANVDAGIRVVLEEFDDAVPDPDARSTSQRF